MLLCVHLEKINWKIDSMRQPNRRFGFSISVWTLPTAVHYFIFFIVFAFNHLPSLSHWSGCLNGLWSFPISLAVLCTTSSPLCLSLCQAWSLCSIKGRSHWCRYWPLRGAAVQVAALARRCCGQTQKHKHQGVWPHGPSPETIRLRPVLLLDAVQTPSQKWPRKHSGTHLLRQGGGTGWECVLNIYIREPLRPVTAKEGIHWICDILTH